MSGSQHSQALVMTSFLTENYFLAVSGIGRHDSFHNMPLPLSRFDISDLNFGMCSGHLPVAMGEIQVSRLSETQIQLF